VNALGEEGSPVGHDFEYDSGTNLDFLTVADIKTLLAGLS